MSLDTRYTAETPEGIALSLRPAGITARFGAYLLDLLIRLGILMLIGIVAAFMGGMGAGLWAVTYFLLEWFYPVFFELMPRHATPGKRSMNLTVVMDSGLPITPAASLLRNLLRAADFLPAAYGLAWLSMLCRSDFKRLGDLAAGTLVVYDRNVVLHGKMPDAPALAPARVLSSREQAAVVAWAGRTERLTPARADELAQLARSVLPPTHAQADASKALLGVSQWLLGRRKDTA
ncbi:MAG: RDD family protein [Pseudomonadota bacterium]